jgi:hypothetical protein
VVDTAGLFPIFCQRSKESRRYCIIEYIVHFCERRERMDNDDAHL